MFLNISEIKTNLNLLHTPNGRKWLFYLANEASEMFDLLYQNYFKPIQYAYLKCSQEKNIDRLILKDSNSYII